MNLVKKLKKITKKILKTLFSLTRFWRTGLLFVFILLAVFGYQFFLKPKEEASAGWWNESWGYRKSIAVSNSSGDVSGQYVKITFNTAELISAGKMQNDCDDIRVTDKNGNLLDYFVDGDSEYDCNDTDTSIYALTKLIPASGANVYLYYGNALAENKEAGLGSADTPGMSCRNILEHRSDSRGDGRYYISPSGNLADKIEVECDMTNDSGGWIKVYEGLASSATSVTRTEGNVVEISNNIPFNQMKVMAKNWSYSMIQTTTETAVFKETFSWYFEWVHDQPDTPNPDVKFHDVDSNQDVQFTVLAQMLRGYGNSWRHLTTSVYNTQDHDSYLYLGGVPSSIHVDDWGYGNYNQYMNNTFPEESGLGLTPREFQEIYVFLRENNITLLSNQAAGTPSAEEKSQGPVGYWSFDEGTGRHVIDSVIKKSGTITNQIKYPSFELGTLGNLGATGWGGYGAADSYVLVDNESFTGSRSARVTRTAGAGNYGIVTSNFGTNVIPNGSSATFSIRYKVTSYTSGNMSFYIIGIENGVNRDPLVSSSIATAVTDGWITKTITYTNSSGGNTSISNIYVLCHNTYGNFVGTVYFDSVQMEIVSSPGNYCDGSLTDIGSHAWTGTAHASTSVCDGDTDGEISGATWKVENECVSGKCLYFDESNDYVILNHSGALRFASGDFSVGAWVKLSAMNGYDGIISVDTTGDDAWKIFRDSGQDYLKARYGNVIVSYPSIRTNEWHYYVMVKSGTTLSVFLDGKLTNSATCPATHANTGKELVFGSYRVQDAKNNNNMFKGFIDEPKIYPYARTDTQIRQDYNAGLAGIGTSKGVSASVGDNSPKWMSDGLVGHWKMDEASWGSVVDSSGNANTGTAYNGATVGAGKFGNGGSFDGTDDYVSVADNNVLDFGTGNFSLSSWVYVNSASLSTNQERGVINKNATFQGSAGWGMEISTYTKVSPFSDVHLYCYNTGQTAWGSTNVAYASFTTNTWHHVSCRKEGNVLQLYVDGSLVATKTHNDTLISVDNAQPLIIGDHSWGPNFPGKLDDVRVYNRALSPQEITDLYNYAPGPVGWWKMDDGSGTTAVDSSGGGNNGTLTSMDGTTDWVSGKYGKALDFDGSNDDLILNSTVNLYDTKDWTVSAWVKTSTNGSILSNNSGGPVANDLRVASSQISYSHYSGSWLYEYGTSTVTDGVWHYLTWVNYSNRTMDMYVDGKKDASGVNSAQSTGPVNSIGRNWSASFNGKIDDVKIYNYARTPKQIVEDMNAGHPAGGSPVGSQLAYWKFDEGHDGTANNSGNGGSALNGTISGATWTNDGKFGKALSFNGSSSYVSHSGSINNIQTITYWIKANSNNEYVIDLGNGRYIRSNGFLSGLGDFNATTYIDGKIFTFGSEIVSNGNMETGSPPTGWNPTTGTTLTRASEERTGGSGLYSLDVVGTDQTWVSPLPGSALTAGKLYQVTNWMKAQSGSGSSVGLIIANATFQSLAISSYTGTTWEKSTLQFMAEPTIHRYLTLGGVVPRNGRFDDVSIKEIQTIIPANEWHHVAIVIDTPISLSNMTVGKVGSSYLNGIIDELKIYSGALTEEEIKIDMNQGKSLVLGAGGTDDDGKTPDNSASREYCPPGNVEGNCASGQNPAPVAEWKFDENTGATANDTSGNGSNGSLAGSPEWVTGKVGPALKLDRVDDRMTVMHKTSLEPASLTISAWVKLNSFGDRHILITKWLGYSLEINSSGYPYLRLNGVTPGDLVSSVPIVWGEWHHIEATFDNTSKLREIYIDGKKAGSRVETGSITYNQSLLAIPYSSPTWASGLVDDVKIYGYARTPAQVAWDYNRGQPVGHWKMDEGEGVTVHDSTGNGNHGTMTNMDPAIDWVVGKLNKALDFDGTNDYVDCGDVSILDISANKQISVSAWVNGASFSGDRRIIDNTNNGNGYALVTNNTSPRFVVGDGTVYQNLDSSKAIATGSWHHLVGVFNDGNAKIYVNGEQTGNSTITGTFTNNPGVTFKIGKRADIQTFNGQIDDVQVYNYALTAEQVRQIMNEGAVNFK